MLAYLVQLLLLNVCNAFLVLPVRLVLLDLLVQLAVLAQQDSLIIQELVILVLLQLTLNVNHVLPQQLAQYAQLDIQVLCVLLVL